MPNVQSSITGGKDNRMSIAGSSGMQPTQHTTRDTPGEPAVNIDVSSWLAAPAKITPVKRTIKRQLVVRPDAPKRAKKFKKRTPCGMPRQLFVSSRYNLVESFARLSLE